MAVSDGASQFIQSLGADAVSLLRSANVTPAVRVERMRTMFNNKFAVESMGQRVLGRYWRQATPAERDEYMALFEDLVVYGYARQFSSYAGQELRVVRAMSEGSDAAMVLSEIVSDGTSSRVSVDWRVIRQDGRYLIDDVVVQGVSLTLTQRSDFAATIKQKGGIQGFLDALRQKTATLKAEVDTSG